MSFTPALLFPALAAGGAVATDDRQTPETPAEEGEVFPGPVLGSAPLLCVFVFLNSSKTLFVLRGVSETNMYDQDEGETRSPHRLVRAAREHSRIRDERLLMTKAASLKPQVSRT